MEYVKGSVGVASVMDKIKENRLRFEHVMRREETEAVRVVLKRNIEKRRGSGRPKMR